jgi:probable HAF family extracellular repeat protein
LSETNARVRASLAFGAAFIARSSNASTDAVTLPSIPVRRPPQEMLMLHRSPTLGRMLLASLLLCLFACTEDTQIAAPGTIARVPGRASASVMYTSGNVTMSDLGLLPSGTNSQAVAISNAGVIVGNARTTTEPPCWYLSVECTLSVSWPSFGASIVSYDYLTQCYGPTTSYSRGINAAGTVVGSGQCYWSNVQYGFVRGTDGVVTQLPGIADYGAAFDVNDNDIAVGYANVTGCEYPGPLYGSVICERAAVWDLSGPAITVTSLGDPPGGQRSYAFAINNASTVVGYFYNGSADRAFVRPVGGTLTDIGTLSGDVASRAQGLSEGGMIVGYSMNVSGQKRAFSWTSGGGMQIVGTLGGTESNATAVNDVGIIVGSSRVAGGAWHAFAAKSGVLVDLGVLPGHSSSEALAINAGGEIVGVSHGPSGDRAVRWTVSFPGATPTGSNVNVNPIDATTGDAAPVSVTFSNVTSGGSTTVTSGTVGHGNSAPAAPNGFRLGSPPTYYDVATTAAFSGSITLCFDYSGASYGNENKLKLLHYTGSSWVDVTTTLNTTTNIICGTATSLSPYLVAEENVTPVVTTIGLPAAPIALGVTATMSASFTDDNTGDTHQATVTWDDGATNAATVTETSGAGSAAGTHTYAAAGVYTVNVSVSDGFLTGTRSSADDQPAYIVVYDPSAGFVTGGGWINSGQGACQLSSCASNGSTTGKASFGFVSRYAKGTNTPSGDTEFLFKAGGLTFNSTSYQWLVVAGAKAQYKGIGTIAGASGTYGFLVTAIDGAISGGGGIDRFRIKIWSVATSSIVYDNQMGQPDNSDDATVLGGGSIVIHK